ncbi:MAG: hypothetical protein RMX96_29735 [Nostoc sp. ChiSLP02]|nr:hypothetical protein [Nostoc sp. DedSLP05]MDZ8100650.1 hypothetical protein [Nostoc sp. DedSLP01]MDZ8189013.1 hypothetical protein [Nostoc sp. ChiSLP02]
MNRSTPISDRESGAIALSAYAGEIDYQQAMLADSQRHIFKPVDPTNLVEAIADLVRIAKGNGILG